MPYTSSYSLLRCEASFLLLGRDYIEVGVRKNSSMPLNNNQTLTLSSPFKAQLRCEVGIIAGISLPLLTPQITSTQILRANESTDL
jgi:hypothetical protein